MFKSYCIILLLVCFSLQLHAQERAGQSRPWSFGTTAYYGALFRYRQGTHALNFTNPYGVSLYAHLQTTGRKRWERQLKYPQLEFGLSYYYYGLPEELGEAYTLTASMGNYIFHKPKSSLRFNLGTGLVYSTRYYIPHENEMNKAIGSKFCFALQGNINYEVPLSQKLFLNFNFAFRHFSNGGLNKPNNGMNFPLIGAGLRYQPRAVIKVAGKASDSDFDKGIHFNLRVATGRKEVLLVDKKHPVYSFSLYASKKFTAINAVLVGADMIYDSSIKNEFINIRLPVPEGYVDPRRVGVTLGHELFVGDVSFIFQLGRYLYQPYVVFPNYYQRYGIKYAITKNISAGAMLLAHTRAADFVEFGLGLSL